MCFHAHTDTLKPKNERWTDEKKKDEKKKDEKKKDEKKKRDREFRARKEITFLSAQAPGPRGLG